MLILNTIHYSYKGLLIVSLIQNKFPSFLRLTCLLITLEAEICLTDKYQFLKHYIEHLELPKESDLLVLVIDRFFEIATKCNDFFFFYFKLTRIIIRLGFLVLDDLYFPD